MGWLIKIGISLIVLYAAAVVLLYVAQTWLIFPTGLAGRGAPQLPEVAERLEFTSADGYRLVGLHVPPLGEESDNPALIIGFGGNAWNADALALYLHNLYPEHHIATAHYRGYAPSTGRPSASAILDDALVVHDALADRLDTDEIVPVGLSIGAGPAGRIAAERPVAGVILVTPFDSLSALARHHYPWVPVEPFLRHRMPIAETVARTEVPAAVITAQYDSIVPAERSEPVIRAAHHLVMNRQVQGANHNDLYSDPAFASTMREALELIRQRQ